MNAPLLVSVLVIIALLSGGDEDAPPAPSAEPSEDEVHAVWSVVSSHNDVGAAVLDGAGLAFYPDRISGHHRIQGMIPARSGQGVPLRTVYTGKPPLTSGGHHRVLFRVLRSFDRRQLRFRLLLIGEGIDNREAVIRQMGLDDVGMDYFWHGAKNCTLVGMTPAVHTEPSDLPDAEAMMIALAARRWPPGIQVVLHNPFAGEIWSLQDGTWCLSGRFGSDRFGGRRPMDYPVWGVWPQHPGDAPGHLMVSVAPPG